MARVLVEPIGVTLEVAEDETLLSALLQAGLDVPHTCSGRGTCGKCVVRLGAGELSEPEETELRRLSGSLRSEGWRLACMARPRAERVSIEVRQTSGRRRILTTSQLHHGAVRPAVRAVLVDLPQPTFEDPRSDVQRLSDALGGADVPFQVIQSLPDVARKADWRLVAVLYERRVVAVYPGDQAPTLYGVAVDIGTSKIIAYLFDLARGTLIDHEAIENPQMRFGEDVISRMAQAFETATRAELAQVVRGGIDACLALLYGRWGIDAMQVCDMTIVANTAMHHLALGLSPSRSRRGAVRAGSRRAAHPAPGAARPRHAPGGRRAFPTADRGVRGLRCSGGDRRHEAGRQEASVDGHRHRHQHRDRSGARWPGDGHELCLRACLRGVPDPPWHEGRGGCYRAHPYLA